MVFSSIFITVVNSTELIHRKLMILVTTCDPYKRVVEIMQRHSEINAQSKWLHS